MKAELISSAMCKELDGVIQSHAPASSIELRRLVEHWLYKQSVHPNPLEVRVIPVRYLGYLQGVKVILYDRENKIQKQVNPRGIVYSAFK